MEILINGFWLLLGFAIGFLCATIIWLMGIGKIIKDFERERDAKNKLE